MIRTSDPADASRSADPAIARRRLGVKLRELREQRSLRLEDVATSLELAPSTLSRIETGKAPTRPCYLATMLDLHGTYDPELRRLLAALAQAGREQSWWTAYNDLLPRGTARYLGMEATASLVRSYSAHTIPALLQTADYAAALCQATRPGITADEVGKFVAITMRRAPEWHPTAHDHR